VTVLHARQVSLTLPIASSAALHAVVLGAMVWRASAAAPVLPPLYRVQLVAAPPGPRAAGVVTERPAPPTAAKAPNAPESTRPLPTRGLAKRAPRPSKAATPNVAAKSTPQPAAAAPRAGGGERGGAGTDVANVNTAGIEFPFPGYLNNIVRQIALAFDPPRNAQSFTAEVAFLIHRDGSVTGIRMLTRSGSYLFDQSALAAVEASGRLRKFGPLPEGFTDDVLPVIFRFDPSRM
jgi:protein TonB